MNETIKNLAKKANMTEQEVSKLFVIVKEEFRGRGVPEEKLDTLTEARVQTQLKKKFAVGAEGKKVSAMFIGKNNARDWAEFHRSKLEKIIGDNNLSKEQAVQKGYINAEGKYLYQNGNDKGKVIPESSWQAKAYGIIDVDGDVRLTTFQLYGDPAEKQLPLFKACKAVVKLREKAPEGEFVATMSVEPMEVEDKYVNFHDYAPFISKTRMNQIISPLSEIENFARTMSESEEGDDRFANWAIVEGSIIKLVPSRYNSIGVVIDDISLNVDSSEDDVRSYTVWFDDDFDLDFVEDAIGVTFVVNTRIGQNDGKVKLNGMGYWVDEWFRKQPSEEEASVQEPWG